MIPAKSTQIIVLLLCFLPPCGTADETIAENAAKEFVLPATKGMHTSLHLLDHLPATVQFKNCNFFSFKFRQYPVADEPPKPYALNNLLLFENGNIKRITNLAQLRNLFLTKTPKGKVSEKQIGAIMKLWLQLAKEIECDQKFEFTEPIVKVSAGKVEGTLKVKEDWNRNRGKLSTTFTLTAQNSIKKIDHSSQLARGIRNRSQAVTDGNQ